VSGAASLSRAPLRPEGAAPESGPRGDGDIAAPGLLLPSWSLWRREMVRFFRQPNRVAGAVGQPLVFWLLIGSGLGASFRPAGGESTLAFFFPGAIVLTILFTSIFASMSTIEDRKEGFLQAVLTAPIPRAALVLGKVGGGATIALVQALLMLAIAPSVGIPLDLGRILAAAGVLALVSFGLTALGFAVAWRMDSTQGFHAFMGLFLFPMWLLSGSFFPAAGAHPLVRAVMVANPLTYGVAAFRRALQPELAAQDAALPGMAVALAASALFGAAGFIASAALTRRREAGGHP
jgi:ABC-2 type transport system permease protein